LAGQVVKLSAISLGAEGGNITGSGSYDLHAKSFEAEANGAGVDVSRIRWLHEQDLDVTGKLAISLTGSGTLDDPRLESHATLSGLSLGGEQLGSLELTAHTANSALNYDVTTKLEGAELTMRGHTALRGDYATQAQLNFSHFNIGALLKLAHVEAITGESALAGTVTLSGPLKNPDRLQGDARLQELAVTLAGVHLQSQGGVHATLANARIHLDPLHITGEDTDLNAQGTLALQGAGQIQLARALERASWIWPPAAPSTSSSPKPSIPISPPAAPLHFKWRRTAPLEIQGCRAASIFKTAPSRSKTFPTASASCTAPWCSTRTGLKCRPSPP
jgi:translocation and assembly module TamB